MEAKGRIASPILRANRLKTALFIKLIKNKPGKFELNEFFWISSLPFQIYGTPILSHSTRKVNSQFAYNNLLVFRNGALKNFNLISLYVTHAEKFPLNKLEAANRTLKR